MVRQAARVLPERIRLAGKRLEARLPLSRQGWFAVHVAPSGQRGYQESINATMFQHSACVTNRVTIPTHSSVRERTFLDRCRRQRALPKQARCPRSFVRDEEVVGSNPA